MNTLPFVYTGEALSLLELTSDAQDSFFGGPFELETPGVDPRIHFHRVMTLAGSLVARSGSSRLIGSIPLIYAFQHDQNEVTYQLHCSKVPGQGYVIDDTVVHGLMLDPGEVSLDWPYRNYPPIFPLINMNLRECTSDERDALRKRHRLCEIEVRDDEVLVGVPTNRTLGFSMWGLEGDKQGILLLFKIQLKPLAVTAWHRPG